MARELKASVSRPQAASTNSLELTGTALFHAFGVSNLVHGSLSSRAIVHKKMKDTVIMLALLLVCGCSRQDTVTVDGFQNGAAIISNERIAVSDLATCLKSKGFDTNCMVYPMKPPTDTSRFTNDTIFLNFDRESTHELMHHVFTTLENSGVGTWPDSVTRKRENAQQGN